MPSGWILVRVVIVPVPVTGTYSPPLPASTSRRVMGMVVSVRVHPSSGVSSALASGVRVKGSRVRLRAGLEPV